MVPIDSRLHTNIVALSNLDPVGYQIGLVGSWSSRPTLAYHCNYIGFVCFLRYIRATINRIKSYKCMRIIKENMIQVDDSMLCVIPDKDYPDAAFVSMAYLYRFTKDIHFIMQHFKHGGKKLHIFFHLCILI